MSKKISSHYLGISPQSSKQLALILIAIHIISFICIAMYSVDCFIKTILSALVLIHGVHSYRYYVSLSHRLSIKKIELNAQGECVLKTSSGADSARLLGSSLITQYLIILNFKTQHCLNSSVILMRDGVSKEEWRKLRVYASSVRC